MTGVFFIGALLFAPERGLLAQAIARKKRKQRFAVDMLLVHLSRHEHTAGEGVENAVPHLTGELNWTPAFAQAAVERASHQGYIRREADVLRLTDAGRDVATMVQAR
jgi:manganese/zinc/iron transport system permease protein